MTSEFGQSKLTGAIIPDYFEFYWPPPAPAKARQLLAEAGYPNGLDAGDYYCDAPPLPISARRCSNSLGEAGIRARLRPIERAGFFKSYSDKTFKGLVQGASAAFGNAATRLEAFVVKGGAYAYGSYPDIDELFRQQAIVLDRQRRQALLARMQQLVHERTIYASIWQLGAMFGVGPRVGESTFGLIAGYPWTSPYEDITIKGS